MKKLFTLLLAVAASVGTMFAQSGTCGQNLIWDLTDGVLTISGTGNMTNWSYESQVPWYWYRASITEVSISEGVTSIGDYAFNGCKGLTSIPIPNSVTSIGSGAFAYCSGLTSPVYNAHVFAYMPTSYSGSYSIPDGIESIAGGAFQNCSGLTSVTIPNSVTGIGIDAFYYCTGLTSITIPNSVTSIGNNAFSGCTGLPVIDNIRYADTYLIEVVDKTLASYTIKEGTRFIGRYAFSGCTGLTSVTIPNSVTSIGEWAFNGCTGLTSIIIPEGVTSIGDYLFGNCSNLKTIELPSTLVIGNAFSCFTFYGGFRLDTLRIAANMLSYGETQTDEYYKNIRYTLAGFYDYNGLNEHDTTNVVYQNIKYIEAPYWFFDVQEQHWSKCPTKIEEIIINRGELNDNVLGVLARQSKTLKTLDISGVTNLPDRAFVDFYNLQSIALPANIEKIGYKALAECVKLRSIDIPASVVEIDDRAFEDCRSLQTITFGGKQPAAVSGKSFARAAETSQLKRIGNWAFYNAHELQHLEIPESVEEIGDAAFYGCVYLEDLVLPSSVQSIGDNCFALCSKLNKIVVSATTPPTIQAKTFYDVKRQIPVYVPDDCVDAYEGDQYWSEFDIQGKSHMPQGIEDVTNDKSQMTNKVIKDGHIYILRGNKIYSISGCEIK